jgi:hypothetical protein
LSKGIQSNGAESIKDISRDFMGIPKNKKDAAPLDIKVRYGSKENSDKIEAISSQTHSISQQYNR